MNSHGEQCHASREFLAGGVRLYRVRCDLKAGHDGEHEASHEARNRSEADGARVESTLTERMFWS